jgi:hypothetical protein
MGNRSSFSIASYLLTQRPQMADCYRNRCESSQLELVDSSPHRAVVGIDNVSVSGSVSNKYPIKECFRPRQATFPDPPPDIADRDVTRVL